MPLALRLDPEKIYWFDNSEERISLIESETGKRIDYENFEDLIADLRAVRNRILN